MLLTGSYPGEVAHLLNQGRESMIQHHSVDAVFPTHYRFPLRKALDP
jgi:hypothetical protein